MLEISICIEVETDQYGDYFCIRHHAFATPFRSLRCRWQTVFRHLDIKFLAKIIGNTENFSNFILGYHDMVFKVWYL